MNDLVQPHSTLEEELEQWLLKEMSSHPVWDSVPQNIDYMDKEKGAEHPEKASQQVSG